MLKRLLIIIILSVSFQVYTNIILIDSIGVKKEDIKLGYRNQRLTINAEPSIAKEKEAKAEKDEIVYLNERSIAPFRRNLRLPEDIDTSKIEAEFKEGLLCIKVPKTKKTETLNVQIK